MIKLRIDVLALLKEQGYTQPKLLKDKKFAAPVLNDFRRGEIRSIATLDKLCKLLDMPPEEIIEYVDK